MSTFIILAMGLGPALDRHNGTGSTTPVLDKASRQRPARERGKPQSPIEPRKERQHKMKLFAFFEQHSQFAIWLYITLIAILLAIFLVLYLAKRLREQSEQEEFQRYFKRLDDGGDKRNQQGL